MRIFLVILSIICMALMADLVHSIVEGSSSNIIWRAGEITGGVMGWLAYWLSENIILREKKETA